MLYIKKTEFQNLFLFKKKQTIDYENTGIVWVTGENHDSKPAEYFDEYGVLLESRPASNGACKSGSVNIPYWILFGETIKKLSKDDVVNDDVGRDCYGHLWFDENDTQYRIERYRKHGKHGNKLALYKMADDEWVDISSTEMKLTQAKIDEILMINKETFLKTILLAREDSSSFLEMNATGRGAIFDNIISLSKFKTYFDRMTKKRTKLNKELKVAETTHAQKQGAVSTLRGLVRNKIDSQIERREKLSNAGVTDTEALQAYLDTKKECDEIGCRMTALSAEYNTSDLVLNQIINSLMDMRAIVAQNKKLYDSLDQHCSSCGHMEEEHESKRTELKDTINDSIADIKTKAVEEKIERELRDVINEKKETERILYHEVKDKLDAMDIDETVFANSQVDIMFLKDAYDAEFPEIAKLREDKYEAYLLMKSSGVEVSEISDELVRVGFWLDILNIKNEDGIKQHMVSKIIPMFNQILSETVDYIFDGNLSIVFDEHFSETIIKESHVYTYNKLSSGEKNKLNLCINKCIKDMISVNLNPVNINFCDEIFVSIDEATIQKFLKEFEKESQNKCIYLIEHSPYVEKNINPTRKMLIRRENNESVVNYE